MTTVLRPAALLAVVATGLFFRLRLAWKDISDSIQSIPDDAFYYFQIARNIANGRNVTFDGETLTNGFHPLWTVLLTPIYFFVDDRDLAVNIGLTLGALLGAGTIVLVYLSVEALTGNRSAALAAGILLAIHPSIVEDSVNGMETSVAVFTIALTSWLFILIATHEGPSTMRAYILLGVAAGLMLLARTDTAFILAPVLLYLLVHERSNRGVMRPVAAGGTALLVVAPWAIWSLVTFGTVIQVSGVAVPDIERQAFLAEHGDALGTQIERSWEVTRTAFYDDVPRWYLTPAGLKPALLLTGVVAVACMLLLPFRERARARRHVGLFAFMVSGMGLMLLFHAGVRWHVREWYYAPVGFYMAVLLGIGVSYIDGVVRGHRLWWSRERDDGGSLVSLAPERQLVVSWRAWVLAGTYAFLLFVLIGVYGPSQEGRWVVGLPHRENMLEGALWMRDNLDEDARIGSFNAGILGYFSERTVVNLDGVVNVDAYEARRDGRTVEYMCAQRLGYLVDLGMAQFASGPACGQPAPSRFDLATAIGDELSYFGGGQVDVLELAPINGGELEPTDVRP